MSGARDAIARLRELIDETAKLRHAETCDRAYTSAHPCTCGLDAADEILVALPALLDVAEAADGIRNKKHIARHDDEYSCHACEAYDALDRCLDALAKEGA